MTIDEHSLIASCPSVGCVLCPSEMRRRHSHVARTNWRLFFSIESIFKRGIAPFLPFVLIECFQLSGLASSIFPRGDFPILSLRQVAQIFSAEQLAALQLALEDVESSTAVGAAISEAPGAVFNAGVTPAAATSTAGCGVAANATALSFLIDPVDMAV